MKKTTVRDIQQWLNNLQSALEYGQCDTPVFLKPFHLLTLATLLKRHPQESLHLPAELARYAVRMHLWDTIELDSPFEVRERDPTGRFLPIVALRDLREVDDSAMQLQRILQRQGMSQKTLASLSTMLFELLHNCFSHADITEGLHGLACAQPWVRANYAQIAVVDGGIGVRQSLMRNAQLKERLANENACAMATCYGVTGKPGKGHSGYGMTLTRDLMEQCGGSLTVVSGYEAFRVCGDEITTEELDVSWQGTLVVLEWPLDQPLDSQSVYNHWPLPEGFDRDDLP